MTHPRSHPQAQPPHPPGETNLLALFQMPGFTLSCLWNFFYFYSLQGQGLKLVCSCLSRNPSLWGFNSIYSFIYGCFSSIYFCESPKLLPVTSLYSFLLYSHNKISYYIDRYQECPQIFCYKERRHEYSLSCLMEIYIYICTMFMLSFPGQSDAQYLKCPRFSPQLSATHTFTTFAFLLPQFPKKLYNQFCLH